jgi:hypothetical protein
VQAFGRSSLGRSSLGRSSLGRSSLGRGCLGRSGFGRHSFGLGGFGRGLRMHHDWPAVDEPAMRRGGPGDGRARDPAKPLGDVFKVRTRNGGSGVRRLYLRVHLGSVHLNAPGRLDSEAHGVTANVQNDDAHVVPDHDALPGTACQHQHSGLLPWTPDQASEHAVVSGQLQAVRRC